MVRILALHASGLTHGQIAREIYVSYSTVSTLVSQIKERMGSRSLAGCALSAHRQGLIGYPDADGNVKAGGDS